MKPIGSPMHILSGIQKLLEASSSLRSHRYRRCQNYREVRIIFSKSNTLIRSRDSCRGKAQLAAEERGLPLRPRPTRNIDCVLWAYRVRILANSTVLQAATSFITVNIHNICHIRYCIFSQLINLTYINFSKYTNLALIPHNVLWAGVLNGTHRAIISSYTIKDDVRNDIPLIRGAQ